MSSISSLPLTSVVRELHALADNINYISTPALPPLERITNEEMVVGPIYGLLKDDDDNNTDDAEEREGNDTNNKDNRAAEAAAVQTTTTTTATTPRKTEYGGRIKAVDALSVAMYTIDDASDLFEYNPNWRQEWEASVTTRRADRAARTSRRGGRPRRVSPLPACVRTCSRHTKCSTAA